MTTEIRDVDGVPVEDHSIETNGEHVTLVRPAGGEPEIVIGSWPYSVEGARRLRDALSELLALVDG